MLILSKKLIIVILNHSKFSSLGIILILQNMSTVISVLDKLQEDLLTCSVCMNKFVGPRMLDCLHTFCFKCVKSNLFQFFVLSNVSKQYFLIFLVLRFCLIIKQCLLKIQQLHQIKLHLKILCNKNRCLLLLKTILYERPSIL